MARLLKGSKASLWKRIRDWAFTDVGVLVRGIDESSLEKLEEILLAADFGVPVTLRTVARIEELIRAGQLRTEQDVFDTVAESIRSVFRELSADTALRRAGAGEPTVWVFAGVNGVGKTTTIAKLAARLVREGRRPLLAAADTFRAGAIDQLRIWADRVGAGFVGSQPGADPAAVAFDAIDSALSRNADTVLIDTAGRLHTQADLMKEIAKIDRVITRKQPGAPHETLLVLDATVGQNAVAQTRSFRQAIRVSGLVLAKLDSTARGGIVVALAEEFGIPVKLVGTGEEIGDLDEFDAERFAREVLSE
ncbi:MAG: signal recognition particle-docking protein FtsY [Gemmatimonadetes bacterium]|nr:signal recognition particle-docking protein FtsY [Gemmatimonadota bacterium]